MHRQRLLLLYLYVLDCGKVASALDFAVAVACFKYFAFIGVFNYSRARETLPFPA
jgi:hypothetical protein